MPTLLLSPRFTPDSVAVRDAAREAGWAVRRLTRWAAPADLRGAPVTVYAEPLFVEFLAQELGLALVEPRFDWLAGLPPAYLGRAVRAGTFAEYRGAPSRRFFKPADDKCFPAKVYEPGEPIPGAALIPGDAPVLVSDPVRFAVEYRVFVRDRVRRAASPYARFGALAQDDAGDWPAPPAERAAAAAFVDSLLADPAVPLPPAVVVDVGKIEGGGWAVVEANPAWGSGRYGCAGAAVLEVIAGACYLEEDVPAAARPWVLSRG